MKKLFWIVLPMVLITGSIIGGVFIYRAGTPFPSPSPLPLETPQVSPAPELKREDLKLQILNGRGVPGTAAQAKEFLEGLGYQNIEVANADSYDYEQTEISIKKDKESYLEQLITDLSDGFRVSEETKSLDAQSNFDAIVTIGKE
jgi:hypothetical protein